MPAPASPRQDTQSSPNSAAHLSVRSPPSIPISCSCSCDNELAMREPGFWWRQAGLTASLLAPFGLVYGAVAAKRMARAGTRAKIPVLCVGNFTLGGTGKTPTVIMLARMLTDAGGRPFCLTRGYGGTVVGPKRVDPHDDVA